MQDVLEKKVLLQPVNKFQSRRKWPMRTRQKQVKCQNRTILERVKMCRHCSGMNLIAKYELNRSSRMRPRWLGCMRLKYKRLRRKQLEDALGKGINID